MKKLHSIIKAIVELLGYVAAGIGVIPVLYWCLKRLSRRVWGGRDKWTAKYRYNHSEYYTGDDIQRTLVKNNNLPWISPVPQKIGDCYVVDLDKERILSEIHEIDIEYDNQIPLKYTLKLYNRGTPRYTEPVCRARDNLYGTIRVSQKFPPTRVERIEIMITEPNVDDNGQPYHWKIYGIRLKEAKLLGRFVHRFI